MKELVIGFLIALCLGAVYNGMQSSQPLGVDQGAMKPGIVGQELVAEVDQSTFQGLVIDSKEPVMLMFSSDTSVPCKAMMPILGKLAINGQGVVRFGRVDSEQNQNLVERYDVHNTPTFVLFKDGHMQDSTMGSMNEDELRAWLINYDVSIPYPPENE